MSGILRIVVAYKLWLSAHYLRWGGWR